MLIPDSVKGWYDHVPSIHVSWQGSVSVQNVFPLCPLGLVMDHKLVGEHISLFWKREGIRCSKLRNVYCDIVVCRGDRGGSGGRGEGGNGVQGRKLLVMPRRRRRSGVVCCSQESRGASGMEESERDDQRDGLSRVKE